MSRAISGIYIGDEICKALKLDASKVQKIELIIETDEIVTVNVTQIVFLKEMKEVNTILTKYNLVPKEE